MDNQAERLLCSAMRIADEAWEEARRRPSVQEQLGGAFLRLPDVSLSEAERRSRVGRDLLTRLTGIHVDEIPHDMALTLRLVKFRAQIWSREADWYWTVIDPLGDGYFGIFLPSAYCGGFVLNAVNNFLTSFHFTQSGDQDRYLAFVADYAELVQQFTARTTGQAERGIIAPKAQIPQMRAMIKSFKATMREVASVDPGRLGGKPAEQFSRELQCRVATQLEPAFDGLLSALGDQYLSAAPDRVGLGQYKDGLEIYTELVKIQTTLSLTPEEIHQRGLAKMADIEDTMQAIRTEVGFEGDGAAFLQHLDSSPRWRVSGAANLTATFDRYLERVKPTLAQCFPTLPRATYSAAPLPEALQGSMTFGYYDWPIAGRAHGRYLFNTANLSNQAIILIPPLTYHELVPGHHLHIATQQENPLLHPFRAYSCINAYTEGWAEYAATLAGELGMYEGPEERYGRLVMEALHTSRLVVDTGMNALGWSLEKARDYMRVHSCRPETEIRTETIRCSCDTPGQALVYKMGDVEFIKMRERMRAAMGENFDLKEFHTTVLGPGGMAFPDLAWHLEWQIDRLQRATCSR